MEELTSCLLKISNSPVLQQFLHECVDDLVGVKAANFDNYSGDIQWTSEDFLRAKRSVQSFFRQIVISGEHYSNLSQNIVKGIKDCLDIRKDEIRHALTKEKLLRSGHNMVENIDWKLKWVLGSSALASIREPLLQVDLHCLRQMTHGDNLVKDTVNFEVNLEALDHLILQLQQVIEIGAAR